MGVLKSIFLDSIWIHDSWELGNPVFRRSSRDHGNLVGENGRRAEQIVRLAKPEDGKGSLRRATLPHFGAVRGPYPRVHHLSKAIFRSRWLAGSASAKRRSCRP